MTENTDEKKKPVSLWDLFLKFQKKNKDSNYSLADYQQVCFGGGFYAGRQNMREELERDILKLIRRNQK